MNNDKELISQIMKNGELPEFVSVDEDALSDADKEEIVFENEMPDGSTPGAGKKVDLIKMAFYYIQGYDTKTMARVFDVNEKHISRLKSSAKFKAVLATLNAEIVSTARVFLAASGMKAVVTLIKCMDSRDDRTKLKASTEVLDRIGIRTPEQLEIIQKGDKISGMDEHQLLEFIKLGMKELPQNSEGEHGEQKVTGFSEG
jgi:hypothetical protein